MLYFAYGSNLNRAHFETLCPAASIAGRAELRDHRLVFRRFADIEPAPGERVFGGLWRITSQCQSALDLYEEVSRGLYRRVVLSVYMEAGGETDALSYRMITNIYQRPGDTYLTSIAKGYADFGIDPAALESAVATSPVRETPGLYATRPDA